MSESNSPRLLRRRLFAATGAVGALAATASLLPPMRAAAVAASEPASSPDQRDGYAATQHVLRYYQTTRI